MPMGTDTFEQVKEEVNIKEPKKFKVILFNDDRTTFQFVIDVLRVVFHKTFEESLVVTTLIHEQGSGVAGIYSQEIAEEKTNEAMMLANKAGFPLQVTYEEY